MAELITGFIKIARAGNTVDGRFIREEWLSDMAETYDPGTYTAMLWPEHMRWAGNYGEVAELKAEKDESGALCLYARLRPNHLLLWQNASGQKLFYSLEVREDFAGTGRAYLEGLAVTDSPASLGMESTRFAARKNAPDTIFIGNVALEPLTRPDPAEDGETPGWFRRCFPHFFTSEAKEKAGMDKETEARFTALEEKFTALRQTMDEQFAGSAGTPQAGAAPAGTAQAGAADKHNAQETPADQAAQFAALQAELTGLREAFAAFTDELRNAVRPGARAGETTAPAGGPALL